MEFYSAYGLTFSSGLPLRGIFAPAVSQRSDFEIRVFPAAPSSSSDPSAIVCLSATPSRVHLSWATVGDLVIEAGLSITAIPAPDADEGTLALLVSGAGMGVLLHQRGLLVLHGSAIRMGGRVVGFLGAKGWGKSTTAMAMDRAGYPLVSDEHLVIALSEEGIPSVLPGTSPARLWEDALITTGGDPATAVQVRSGLHKYYSGNPGPPAESCPLQQIFLLDVGEQLGVEKLPPSSAFFSIAPHLYVYRFGTKFLQGAGATGAFRQLTRLAQRAPISRLIRPPGLSLLPEIVRLVESSCSRCEPRASSSCH